MRTPNMNRLFGQTIFVAALLTASASASATCNVINGQFVCINSFDANSANGTINGQQWRERSYGGSNAGYGSIGRQQYQYREIGNTRQYNLGSGRSVTCTTYSCN